MRAAQLGYDLNFKGGVTAFSWPSLGAVSGYIADSDSANYSRNYLSAFIKLLIQPDTKKLHIIAHSMGGLVARAWMRNGESDHKIHHVVTIASPHSGTTLGHGGPRLSSFVNGEQMRVGSEWLRALAKTETAKRSRRFTCFYSNCDNIVMPASAGRLPGADNRMVPGVPHLAMVFNHRVIHETLALL